MNRAAAILALVTCACLVGCADAPVAGTAADILGGRPATASDALGAIALVDTRYGDLVCSGTLVAPTVVITAAHCLVEMNEAEDAVVRELGPADLRVHAGALDISSGEVVEIRRVARDPAFLTGATYDADGLGDEHDIGIVILATPVTDQPIIPLVPSANVDELLVPGSSLTIAGFGAQTTADDAPYGVLMVAATPFLRHGASEILTNGTGMPDTCFGDSGGPALVSTDDGYRLVGVTSRGATDAPCGAANSVFTLAPAYLAELAAWSGLTVDELAPPMHSSAPPPPPPDAGMAAHDAGHHSPTHDAGMPSDPVPSPRPHHTSSGSCSIAPGATGAPVALGLVLPLVMGVARRRAKKK